jgi:hypothetical protein
MKRFRTRVHAASSRTSECAAITIALSEYFEDAARKMQAKAEEEKKLLGYYEEKNYLYGRRAQDLKAHTCSFIA